MLSYQHSYHAGNPADVHKHIALVLVLRQLALKARPQCFIDCHAGRGVYDLAGEAARKTNEAAPGILKLAAALPDHARLDPAVADYLGLVRARNKGAAPRFYPGSAALALDVLGAEDRAILLELHPAEYAALARALGADRRVSLHARDCYEGLPGLLPPPIRRGLVLLDPSYERKDEFDTIVELLERALARWATGIYLLWYPILPEGRHRRLLAAVEDLAPPKTVVSEFRFGTAVPGLQGSGLVVVNTPWQLDRALADAMRVVAGAIAAEAGGYHELAWLTPA